jgi:DNA-binding NtrC family response regulator
MAKILMVDDDQDFISACQTVLEAQKHEVTSANNVTEAEAKVKGGSFDIIFLDIMMDSPDDGIAYAHKLKKAGITTPIVMLSAVSKVTGLEYGKCDEVMECADFIEKPVSPQVLIGKVNDILSKDNS